LLHKHPERFQSFDLSFGKAHVYYPEVSAERCTACLLLDVDSVGMVRGKNADQSFLLAQYVNDRPYTASSFMSVAIAQVFGSALQGRCKDRPDLATTAIPLSARIDVLPVRGGERFLRGVFEPLGYEVEAVRGPLDERFPEWGDSPYFSVTVRKTTTLSDLLTHLYVLIPVFDNRKHYWVGDDEMEKLLAKGEGWLASHPEKEERRTSLVTGVSETANRCPWAKTDLYVVLPAPGRGSLFASPVMCFVCRQAFWNTHFSAVVGSMIEVISEMRFAGNPPCLACSRTIVSSGAMYTQYTLSPVT
jgi:3' terminal RNA ribose 2'-O-methyltransferase Hen1